MLYKANKEYTYIFSPMINRSGSAISIELRTEKYSLKSLQPNLIGYHHQAMIGKRLSNGTSEVCSKEHTDIEEFFTNTL